MKKIWATPIATATLLLIIACSADGTVAPGEGLAPTPTSTSASTPSETSTPDQGTPNFKEKYTYDDGVAVEVTGIKTGRLTRQQAADEYNEKIKAGTPYAVFTVRVKNNSRERLSLGGEGIASYGSLTYGPEGVRAEELFTLSDIGGVSGTILPGKAKTGHFAYAIPDKYWNDVVLEFGIGDTVNSEREPVIFAGPIN
jgi:ABC-type glycerol-3-phosphate transport system substrate-binding protein